MLTGAEAALVAGGVVAVEVDALDGPVVRLLGDVEAVLETGGRMDEEVHAPERAAMSSGRTFHWLIDYN